MAMLQSRFRFDLQDGVWTPFQLANDRATHYNALVQAWRQQAVHGDLLMCHPAVNAPDSDALATARQAEFEVLSGLGLWEALQQAGDLRLGAMIQILALPDSVFMSY